jgi:FkbM family methyltransferase
MTDLNYYAYEAIKKEDLFGIRGWTWPKYDVYTWPIIANDWYQHHRPKLVEQFEHRKGGTALMAGGNCGMYPLLLLEFFSLVYTFEPDPRNFYYLSQNCQFPNIIKMNAGLGETSGFCTIKANSENCGMNKTENVQTNSIPIMTIDSFDFQQLDFLMLDTEDSELPALKGAANTIKKFSPIMILELGDIDDGYVENYNACTEFLSTLGYDKPEKIGRLDYLFIKA